MLVNDKEIHQFKIKDSGTAATLSCLGNISKDWSVDNMRKTGLCEYVYDVSFDYDVIAIDDIWEIQFI